VDFGTDLLLNVITYSENIGVFNLENIYGLFNFVHKSIERDMKYFRMMRNVLNTAIPLNIDEDMVAKISSATIALVNGILASNVDILTLYNVHKNNKH
jgi:hypothetical protein